ncbi:MAG TPA: hypothetical protein VIP77_16060 [Jiangellaceae bacterium]
MVTTTDNTQPITATTSQVARWCAIGAGLLGAFLTGILLATSIGDYGFGLTRTGWDLARGGTIFCGIIAMLSGLTWWGVEQVVGRLGERADRNRDATLAMAYRLEQVLAEQVSLRAQVATRAVAAVKPSPYDHEEKAAEPGLDPASVQALRRINGRLNP